MNTKPRVRGYLFVALSLLISLSAFAGRHQGVDISTGGGRGVKSCDDWKVRIDNETPMVSSETIEIGGSSLGIEAAKNGGISISGGNARGFSVTICRAASASLGSNALSEIKLVRSGDSLSIDGPSGGDWVAYFIVHAPAGASVRASSTNGPVNVSDFDGSLDLDAKNGPISLEKVSGKVTATTKNGPLSLREGSGEVSLKASNGPVSVKLSGGGWIGQSLDASSVNGPLTLAVPRGFSSGVEIRSAGHTPWDCPEDLCGVMAKSWHDDADEEFEDRVVRFGGATPVIRLSTENGPVSVKEQ